MDYPKLYITCYRHQATDDLNRVTSAPQTPPLAELSVDITSESLQSHEFPQYTTFVIVKAEADCFLAFGEDPEADHFHFVEAGERLPYGVVAGHKIAVVEAA